MSDFALEDLGDGRFALSGEMSFDTAERILEASEKLFADHTSLEIDLSGVRLSDSPGLALLLEWFTWANHTVRASPYTGSRRGAWAVGNSSEVDGLLTLGERWSGFIEAPEAR